MQRLAEFLVIVLACLSAVVLIALQRKPEGWAILAAAFCLMLVCRKTFNKHVSLVLLSLALLGITPIDTDIKTLPALTMATTLSLAIAVPWLVNRYVHKENVLRFSWHHGRVWYKKEIAYIAVSGLIAYLLLPFYLKSTGAYVNWPNPQNESEIIRLFIGTNALGIWDELFFVGVVLSLLRRHFNFWFANVVQAVMWSAFLYELGFISWAFIIIIIFALLQGYIYKKTESLLYIITIHLTIDLFLFLALINAHDPSRFQIFIT